MPSLLLGMLPWQPSPQVASLKLRGKGRKMRKWKDAISKKQQMFKQISKPQPPEQLGQEFKQRAVPGTDNQEPSYKFKGAGKASLKTSSTLPLIGCGL